MRRIDFFFFFPFLHWQRTSEIEGRGGEELSDIDSIVMISDWRPAGFNRARTSSKSLSTKPSNLLFSHPLIFCRHCVCVCVLRSCIYVCVSPTCPQLLPTRTNKKKNVSEQQQQQTGGPVRFKCIFITRFVGSKHTTHTLYIALCLPLLVSSLYCRPRRLCESPPLWN